MVDLHGCSRKCSWCDHYTHNNLANYMDFNAEDILYRVSNYSTNLVKITGGEPTENEYLLDLVKILKKHHYNVTIETNGDREDDSFFIADTVIVDIKAYSAGSKSTTIKRINQLKGYGNVVLKGTIQNQSDIDYFHTNFRTEDLWLFKEETRGRTEIITERLLLNPNWRICFRTDNLIGLDFDSAYKRLYGGAYDRKSSAPPGI